jgi:hypothetical protein
MYAIPRDPLNTTPAPFHLAPDRGAESELTILLVHYVWPRRVGEPAGGPPLSYVQLVPELQAPTITEQLVSRYCPDAITSSSETGDVCWIVFSHEGRVLRTGQSETSKGGSLRSEQLRSLHPDLYLTEIRSEPVRYPKGDRRARLMLAWSVPDVMGILDRPVPLLQWWKRRLGTN